jgi:lysozyme
LTQNQFDALVSFAFNVGVAAFLESTLLRLLNGKAYDMVPDQLKRWSRDNGHIVPGLTHRRQKEIDLWRTP